MFWNIGRILFSSIPLSKENTHCSLSVFQSCSYGTIGEKEEFLRNFTENREIFRSGEVQKYLWELGLELTTLQWVPAYIGLLSVPHGEFVGVPNAKNVLHALYKYPNLWIQLSRWKSDGVVLGCAVLCLLPDLSQVQPQKNQTLPLLPWFSFFSPGLWSILKMNRQETKSEPDLFLQKSKEKLLLRFIKLE